MPHELLKNFTYPVYPNSEWASVADVPTGAPVLDGGVVKQSQIYFDSDGTDYIDCGRPPFLNSLRPQVDQFTIRAVIFKDSSSVVNTQVFGIRTGSTVQFGFNYGWSAQPNQWAARVGSTTPIIFTRVIPDGQFVEVVLKATTTTLYVYFNKEFIGTVEVGSTIVPDADLLIGIYSGGIFNGGISSLSFYSGVGNPNDRFVNGLTKIDCYNLNTWDGGPTLVSEKGNIATVTDGIPSTARQKTLLPLDLKC